MTLIEAIERHLEAEFDIKEDIKHPEEYINNLDSPAEVASILNVFQDSLEYTQMALAALEEKRNREAIEPCDDCDETYYQYDCEESYESGRAFYSVDCNYCPKCGRLLKKG